MNTKKIKKIVLAYSGGLDTTVILHWLKETYGAEVITFTADIGQDHNPEEVNERANLIGANKVIIEDLKEDFVKDYVFPMFRANTLYEGEYLLGTSIARPLISKRMDLLYWKPKHNRLYRLVLLTLPLIHRFLLNNQQTELSLLNPMSDW